MNKISRFELCTQSAQSNDKKRQQKKQTIMLLNERLPLKEKSFYKKLWKPPK